MTSSGLVTTMMIASGDTAAALLTTPPTIPALVAIRSSRLMPGFRGMPEVTTMMSEPALSA